MADKGNRNIMGQTKEKRKVLLDPTGRITGYRVEKWTSGGTIWERVKFSTERRIPSSSSEVTKSKPARTKKTEHRVLTKDVAPVQQRPYRIHYAFKVEVMKELEEMETKGIIEPSTSA